MAFTELEQEVIVLNAVWGMIDDMVNPSMFVTVGSDDSDVTELRPRTTAHKQLFNILLRDFLSVPDAAAFDLPKPPDGSPLTEKTYLFYLKRICERPQLDSSKVFELREHTNTFVDWLSTDCVVENVWFPSIDTSANLKVQRIAFITICGNIAKHSFAGLSRDSKLIAKTLSENGINLDDEQRFLIIPEFYEWFHENIFSYHLNALAEFLNNLRWGIHAYLEEVWMRAYAKDDPAATKYRYEYPDHCTHVLPQSMFWDLMNRVLRKPSMPRFNVTPFLKMRY
ncbi:MAG: hypothetical protein ABSD74_09810 [Rhizomicrobium sp.]|jgi:hypothetical protein